MLKLYALLISKWTHDLQSNIYTLTGSQLVEYERKQQQYTNNMNKLYIRLNREYGFTKEKFYALREQAGMF